jgi:hypothetical protein
MGVSDTISHMSIHDVLYAIDAQISNLEQARALLTGPGTSRRGKKSASTRSVKVERVMSPEARKRIGDAQRKRWAEQKKATK